MTKKKTSKSNPPRKSKSIKGRKLSSKSRNVDSVQHYNAVLIEELRSEFRFVIEHVSSVEGRIMDTMNQRFAEVDADLTDIRKVLAIHSEAHARNEKRWEENERRWEENERRWDNTEKRFEIIDHKLEIIDQKMDHLNSNQTCHDKRIEVLESSLK